MTWRVAILAFTIMLAGATRADHPRRRRRPRRLPRDGRGDGAAHPDRRADGLPSAPAARRSARVEPGPGSLRDQLRIVASARDFRWLLTTFVVQALGDRLHAGRRRLPGQRRARRPGRRPRILFVCFVAPALLLTPAVGPGRRADRQEAGLRDRQPRLRWPAARRWCPLAGAPPDPLVFVATALVGRRVRRRPGVPDGDAPRRGGGRRPPHRQQPGRRLHRRLDRRRDPRARARSRGCSRSCSRSAATAPPPTATSPSPTPP